MPPSRFAQVSRYRNATLVVAKPHERFAELALGAATDNGLGALVAVSPVSSHIFARSSTSSNSLIVLPHDAARKYAKQPPALHSVCSGGAIGDFDLARFQDDERHVVLAAGSSAGSVTVRKVTLPDGPSEDDRAVMPEQEATGETMVSSVSKAAITNLQFNPACASLLMSASAAAPTVDLWDAYSGSFVHQIDAKSHVWHARWDVEGGRIATSGKDAVVRLWDARNPQASTVDIQAHGSKIKPTKLTFITAQTSHLLLTAGFSQMRQREIAVWDVRNRSSAVKRITLDVASSGLEPLCDHDRGIVYMLAKGDSSVRWIDVGSQDQGPTFAEGVHQLNDVSAAGAAIAPLSACDTGVGEIARLYVATAPASSGGGGASSSDAIVPASVRVPRRNYIDFHSDLYPETVDRSAPPGTSVEGWRSGQAARLELQSLDPSARKVVRQRSAPTPPAATSGMVQTPVQSEATVKHSIDAPIPVGLTKDRADIAVSKSSVSETPAPPLTKQEIHATSSGSTVVQDQRTPPSQRLTPPPSKSPISIAAHWSRRPLAGATPLIPAYQNLGSLDTSRGPDSRMLAVSRKYLFLPLAGPGGRLGIHPVASHGRLPLHIPFFSHGTAVLDFAVDPFSDEQVYTVSGDGLLRLWKVAEPKKGEQGLELDQDELVGDKAVVSSIALPGTAKVSEILAHPYVQGLVAVLPADADGKLLLVDVPAAKVLARLNVPGNGLHSGAWSFDGSVLAVCAKDRKVYVLDIRQPPADAVRILGEIDAHDSARSFRVLWIDGLHVLTVGHTLGSLRQLKLYRLAGEEGLELLAKHNMDASPSFLFPHWDPDTNILWLWSKGERIVSAFELQPDAQAALRAVGGAGVERTAQAVAQRQQQDTFTALPAFQHGQPQLGLAFLPKDVLDVRNVEVAAAVRLSRTELQRVGWSVPRSRPEFFQDDVFPPTVLVRQPLLAVADWLDGKDVASPPRTSLQPADMTALSQAPAPEQKTSALSKGPTKRQMTEKEQEDAMFRDIFQKAKGNDRDKDPNHNEEQAARAPSDDDWDED